MKWGNRVFINDGESELGMCLIWGMFWHENGLVWILVVGMLVGYKYVDMSGWRRCKCC